MRSGSAAIARNGKIDVMPITWKSACASESEKTKANFVLPYGRARKRTRRMRSATLWINRDKAVPSYTFKNNGTLHLATAGMPNYLRERLYCQKLGDVGAPFAMSVPLSSRSATIRSEHGTRQRRGATERPSGRDGQAITSAHLERSARTRATWQLTKEPATEPRPENWVRETVPNQNPLRRDDLALVHFRLGIVDQPCRGRVRLQARTHFL